MLTDSYKESNFTSRRSSDFNVEINNAVMHKLKH
jgi:hypothetical protein